MNSMAATHETSPARLPRAEGVVRVSSKLAPNGSVLDGLFQKGAFKAVFPRSQDLTAVMVNTAGGVTGGDRFTLAATAGPKSSLTLTTQAAERAYRALPHETGRVRTKLAVDAGARLFWLPQETIVFDGADFERRLRCDMAADATLVFVEPLIVGRAAMGETRVSGRISERIEIFREGALLFRDAWTLSGDISTAFSRKGVGSGARAMASILVIDPRAPAMLESLRDILGKTGGASLRAPDVLAARILAQDGYALRKQLVPALNHITHNSLPTCWRL